MVPKTADEMYSLLFRALIARLYGDLSTAARQGRQTEHDIARIERNALDFLRTPEEYAAEFPDFDARAVSAAVLKEVEELLAVTRAGRVKQVQKQH